MLQILHFPGEKRFLKHGFSSTTHTHIRNMELMYISASFLLPQFQVAWRSAYLHDRPSPSCGSIVMIDIVCASLSIFSFFPA